jgi:hypothetical protein
MKIANLIPLGSEQVFLSEIDASSQKHENE